MARSCAFLAGSGAWQLRREAAHQRAHEMMKLGGSAELMEALGHGQDRGVADAPRNQDGPASLGQVDIEVWGCGVGGKSPPPAGTSSNSAMPSASLCAPLWAARHPVASA